LKISRNTARYQLKSVFAKTDTHRQGGEALYRAGEAINRKAVCAPAAPTASVDCGGFHACRDGVEVASLRLP
jgi:hypothetical protein